MSRKHTLIFCLFFFTLLLLPGVVSAQVIQGETPTGLKKNVQVDANGNLITSPSGGSTAADVRIRDGVTPGTVTTVARPNADAVDPASTYALDVMGNGYCLDASNKWDRIHCGSVAAAGCQCVAPSSDAYFRISATGSVNAVTNPIYERISIDGTNALGASYPMPISATAAANAVTNPIYNRISVDGTNPMSTTNPLPVSPTAAANAQANPFYCAVSKDGSVNSATDPIATRLSADGTNYLSSTYPLPISATNAANTSSNPIYMYKAGSLQYLPAVQNTATIGASLVDVLSAIQVINYPNFCVVLRNNDGAHPLTDAAIFESPIGSPYAWESLSWTACDTLAHGGVCSYCVSGNAYNYIKVQAAADVTLTVSSVDAWLTANVN